MLVCDIHSSDQRQTVIPRSTSNKSPPEFCGPLFDRTRSSSERIRQRRVMISMPRETLFCMDECARAFRRSIPESRSLDQTLVFRSLTGNAWRNLEEFVSKPPVFTWRSRDAIFINFRFIAAPSRAPGKTSRSVAHRGKCGSTW